MNDMNESGSAGAVAAVVFLDFDGTITCRDATDAILETYAPPEWRQVEEEWARGRIGSRECLTRQMALVRATAQEIDSLLDTIEVDAGLVPLLDICRSYRLPVRIVSDGFDRCIHRILWREALNLGSYLATIPIVSSRLEDQSGQWQVRFTAPVASCEHGCATCKPLIMNTLNPAGRPTIFIGDGLSDRFAATCADFVFAKGALAEYCDQHAVLCNPYESLATVARDLGRLVGSSAMNTRTCCRAGA
jgi:2-hydroxy-3-keto-5-methylthiopentenyl-1-phosphate phosphatase